MVGRPETEVRRKMIGLVFLVFLGVRRGGWRFGGKEFSMLNNN
jgi:hypothetical protein